MTLKVWQYSNNGAMSRDGYAQLSGVDRARYLVRFGADLVLISCENFTVGDVSKAALYLSQPMQWITADGPRDVTSSDRTQLRAFLESALPIIGREPIFE